MSLLSLMDQTFVVSHLDVCIYFHLLYSVLGYLSEYYFLCYYITKIIVVSFYIVEKNYDDDLLCSWKFGVPYMVQK